MLTAQFIIVLLGFVVVLTFVLYYVDLNRKKLSTINELPFVGKDMFAFNETLKDCNKTLVACTNDQQCNNQCFTQNVCRQGACKPKVIESTSCDLSKGMITTFQYNEILQQYEKKCLSTDPSIAISNTENNWCQGGLPSYLKKINYLKERPNLNDCQCPYGQVRIPVFGNVNRRLNFACIDNPVWRDLRV